MLFHWWWNLSNLHIYSIKRNGLPFLSIKFLDWLAICENSKTKILKYAWFTFSHQLKIPVACFTSEWAECTQCIGNPFPHQLCSKRRFFWLAYSSKDFAKNHVKVSLAACTRNIVGTHSVQSVQPRHTQKQSVLQSVHSTLGYTTSFSAKRSVVLTN